MDNRLDTTLKTDQVFCVTDLETGKWHRLFSPEQLREHVDSGRINEKHRVTLMHSNSGLGGNRS